MRQADLLDGRPGRLERGHGLTDAGLHARLHAGHEVLAWQAEALAAQRSRRLVVVGRERGQGRRDRLGRRRRVAVVATGDRVEEGRRVAGVAPERADLVERARERHDPVATDPAVGRLHPDHAAQRRGLADGAAGIGADRQRRVVGRHGRRRASAAAAGDAIERPRVDGRAVGGMLGRRAHRELVHVGLAEDHRARRPQPLGDVRVVRRHVPLEDPRARGALAAGHRDEVLERHGDAQQRTEPVERVSVVGPGGGQAGVGGVGLRERPLAIDGQPDVECPVVALGGGEVRLGQLVRRDLAAPQESRHLVGVQARDIGHRAISARRGSPARR